MEIVFQRGISRVPNSMVSVTSFIDGAGGKMYSFWAMNSLRMSFWSVPASWARGTPLFSAAAMYIAQIIAAGQLIVIEVVISSSGMPVEQDLHVGQRRHGHAARAELALGHRVVVVVAVERRHVEGDRQAGIALPEQCLEARVRLLGRAESGEHAHRPQPARDGRWDGCRA